jgi:hypothetical protein
MSDPASGVGGPGVLGRLCSLWSFYIDRAGHGAGHGAGPCISSIDIEVLNVKVGMFILLLFASLPDCSQNQIAVSDAQHSLSDF